MSLYNLVSSLNLTIGTKDYMYDNIKIMSNYIDTDSTLSKLKKGELSNVIEGLKNYLTKDNEIDLDIDQRKIVESNICENQRIIAGAGSGKTTTILYRIKYLLDNYVTPDRILVLTFNRDSAQNIRNRIKQVFGFDVYIKIYTIDAFCCKLFNNYGINNNILSLTEYCSMGLKIMQQFGKEISSQFKYIFFDEFQDVNDIQFNILKIFVNHGCYLTVIGDDYQNIYQFRGTNNYYMINFDRIFPNSNTYFLKTNYRSSENIVQLANTSISHNKDRVNKDMFHNQKNTFNNKPELIINNTERDTCNFLINKIKDYVLNHNVDYQDICILSRNSYPLKMMETELTKHEIPHVALITDKNSDDTKKLIEPNKLVLTTIHKSKGLEWSVVFIIGLSHQHFPEHLNNNIKNIEEERRLFYVATTRCKKHLHFVSHLNEFPLSIFLKECENHIDIFNNTDNQLTNFLGGNGSTCTKNVYGVTELISILNENDFEKLRETELIINTLPETKIAYENKLTFTPDIKKNAFEPDLGEYCDRYITRNIIRNLNGEFIDIDTEHILRESLQPNDKRIINLLAKDVNNLSLQREYIYPEHIIDKLIDSYKKIKTQNYDDSDIYWISLCRNFKLERRRLVYRDIFNLIENNILFNNGDDSLIKRMNDYVNLYSTHENIKCKVPVKHQFFNQKKEKCFILGEIDMIDNDTIIDIKCSESEFKLEWLIQLLIYYSLLENNTNINKLCIINIMNGYEYLFEIPESYKTIEIKNKLIKYMEKKILDDQQSKRNYLPIDQLLLETVNINNIKHTDVQFVLNTKEYKTDNFMVLDTETTDFNGDIIQLAYIIVDNNFNIIKTVNKYIKDRIPTINTVLIHGITVNKLRNEGVNFNDVIKEFISDLKNVDYIVGHNIGFDLRTIINNLRKFEIKIITDGKINYNVFNQFEIKDTYTMSNKKLEVLYNELFNKPINGAHNALNDVLATFECYQKIVYLKK